MKPYSSVWTHLQRTPHRLDWVEVGGVRTRYLEAGKKGAPAVVMLHGLAGSLENFCANIAAFSADFHVWAIDLLGCGWNDRPPFPYLLNDYAEHVHGFFDAVGIERASLVGVSLGSAVAVKLAISHPDRVAAIVMVTPAGLRAEPDAQASSLKESRKTRQDAVDNPSWDKARAMFKRLILHDENIIDDIVAVRLGIYSTREFKEAMPNLMAVIDEGGIENELWRGIAAPMLIVAAPDGQSSYYKNAELIASLVPGSKLVEIHDVDHWAQFEAPDAFNSMTLGFLRDLSAA